MSGERRRRVLVLNHFAVPRAAPGGTRHVELFGRLQEWDAVILASNRNLLTGHVDDKDDSIRMVWTTPPAANGAARIVHWASYAVTAFVGGLHQPTDVVYASSPHLLAGLTGWALATIKRVPLVIEVRDLWPQVLAEMGQLAPESHLFRLLKQLERFLYRHADAVVVLAEGSRASVVADGADPDHVIFLPNGADPGDFDVSEDRATLRARYGMEGLVFLYAGAHGRANGLELVLDAAETLRHTHPEIRFWLVGDGYVKPALVKDAAARGLNNVTFRDPVPKSEMPALLAAADVGLHVLADVPLFRHGVSPNKLFDYMAAGLPVLTNTPGEVGDMVRRANAGVAADASGLAVGAAALAELDAAGRDHHGLSGRRFIREHRSRSVIAQDLAAVLDDVARRRRRLHPGLDDRAHGNEGAHLSQPHSSGRHVRASPAMGDLKDAVRDFWDAASCGEVYAVGETLEAQFAAHSRARYELEPYIRDFAGFDGAGKDVLEVGVGMGADHVEWAKSRPNRLAGVDFTPRAVEWTSKRIGLAGFRTQLQVGDAENLPFPDASFDVVYSWGVLHHTPDTRQAFREVHRVLRPGGEARIMIYHRPSIVGLLLWAQYAALARRPFRSLTDMYAQHLESPGTKGYTVREGRSLAQDFAHARVTSAVSFGDLLDGEVGQRHSSAALDMAKRVWPRPLVRRLSFLGLMLEIRATK